MSTTENTAAATTSTTPPPLSLERARKIVDLLKLDDKR